MVLILFVALYNVYTIGVCIYKYNSQASSITFFGFSESFDEGRIFFYWGELDYWVDLYGTNEFLDFIFCTKWKQRTTCSEVAWQQIYKRLRVVWCVFICVWCGWKGRFFTKRFSIMCDKKWQPFCIIRWNLFQRFSFYTIK